MSNGNETRFGERLKIGAIIAAIIGMLALAPLLPLEFPLFPASDSTDLAYRLFRDGDCKGGYAILEKRAAKGSYNIGWSSVGSMKYRGKCGAPDYAGAIKAYRKSAREGSCSASFNLAGISYLHPNVPGIEQIDFRNNLLASALCSQSLADDELMAQTFESEFLHDGFDVLKSPMREALAKRQVILALPYEEQKKITEQMRDGIGYDANPNPYDWVKLQKPLK